MEKLEDKLISVIVPVYNVEKYMVKCMDSLRAQSYRNMEILLVDDGSTDGSATLCDCYAKIDPRIRVIHKENGGLSSARNAGLDAASGEYVYFLDSDDYIEPQLLEKTVKAMEDSESDWCGFWAVKEDMDANVLYRIAFEEKKEDIRDEEERFVFLLGRFLNYYTGWEVCFHVYRRSVIEHAKLRFVSERRVFAEDLLFSFCYLLYAESYVILPEVFYHYVERNDSLMQKKKGRNVLPFVYALGCEAYKEVKKAGLEFIEKQFGLIYLAFLEWHTRFYISSFGAAWVDRQLKELPDTEFLPSDRCCLEKLYWSGMSVYGSQAGAVTVILPVPQGADVKQVEQFVRGILQQSIQRLEILLICEGEIKIDCRDFRIRYLENQGLDLDMVIRLGFEESCGEYLYFADCAWNPPVNFLERLSDAMKYNRCNAGIAMPGEKHTVILNGEYLKHRKELRQRLHHMAKLNRYMVVRKNLLMKSGLSCMKNLDKYWKDIILAGQTILLNENAEGGT